MLELERKETELTHNELGNITVITYENQKETVISHARRKDGSLIDLSHPKLIELKALL